MALTFRYIPEGSLTQGGGGTPNPDALPGAVASSAVGHSAGDLAANLTASGSTWTDPNTGCLNIRLTDSNFPNTNSDGFTLDYSNCRGLISQVWNSAGDEFVTVAFGSIINFNPGLGFGTRWLLDVNIGTGAVVNPRTVPASDADISFVFSQRTETPRHAFYTSGGNLNRINTETMQLAHDGDFAHFPVSGPPGMTFGTWLHGAVNDSRFKWEQLGGAGSDIRIVHDVATQSAVVLSTAASPIRYGGNTENEAYLTVDGLYELGLWDGTTGAGYRLGRISNETSLGEPQFGANDADMVHPAIAFDWVSWVERGPQNYYLAQFSDPGGWDTEIEVFGENGSTPIFAAPGQPSSHDNAGWVLNNPDKWMLTGPDSAGAQSGPGAINGNGCAHWHGVITKPGVVPEAKTLYFYDGEPWDGEYYHNAFGNLSLDGRTFAWNSPLNTGGRSDIILGVIPTN